MPIKVPIQLDNDSLDDVRSHAQRIFDGIGTDAGQGFTSGLTRELDQIGPSFLRMGSLAEGALGGMSTGALAAAGGIAALGTAAVLVGEQFYAMGDRFDAISDSIAVRTGKMGDDLSGMMGSLNTVASNTASSVEDIGDVMGRVSQSLGATGDDLTYLTKQISDLDRMTGENLNIRDLGRVMRSFGQDAGDAASDLDTLEAASQRSGLPLNELLETMVRTGPAARSLHLEFDQLAGLLVMFEKAGLDTANAQMAFNHAAGQFADHGINMATGLRDTITQMKIFIDTGEEWRARQLAGDVFGGRAADRFFDMVKNGVLDANSLNRGLENTKGTIEDLNKRTADWHETWQQIEHRVDILIDKVGGPLFDSLNRALKLFAPDTPIWQQGQVPPFQTGTPSGTEPGYVHPQGPYVPTVIPPGGWQPHTYDQSTTPKPGQPGFIGPVPIGTPTGPQMGAPPGTPPPPPGGPGAPPGQDVAGALGQDANKPGGKPGMPAIPMPTEYGQPPRPGETLEDWQQRQRVMEAENALETDKARVAQMEAANNDTDEKNNFTADEITRARNEVAQAEGRLYAIEHQNVKQRRQNLDEVQVPYPAGFGVPPRPGETAEQYGREQSALEATHKRQQAEAQLEQVRSDATSTQNDIQKAENAVTAARENEYEAIMRLNTATKEGTDQLGEFGAKLDADFGMSKGLPGLAENLFKFLANLTFSPVFGAMRGAQAALGFPGGQGSGSGVMGMIGSALGIGQPHTGSMSIGQLGQGPFGLGSSGATGSVSVPGSAIGSISNPADLAAGGNRVTALYALAQSLEGTPYSQSLRNDCSGLVSQLAAAAVGLPPPPASQRFNTTNEGEWLAAHGFQMGAGPPGSFRIGWNPAPGNAGHTAATLPGGENFEQGGPHSSATFGPEARGAAGFPMQAWLPMGVTARRPGANWDAIAQRESGGNWTIPSDNQGGPFRGGLQILDSTWRQFGGLRFAPTANLATKDQQISIAESILAGQGPRAWPNTFVPGYQSGGEIKTAEASGSGGGIIDPPGQGSGPWSPGRHGAQPHWGMPPTILNPGGGPYGSGSGMPDWWRRAWEHSGAPGWWWGESHADGGAVPIVAHEGEHVLTAGDVKAMGGQQAVYGFRAGLQQKAGAQGLPPSPLLNVGAMMPTFGGATGGPMPGASPVGAAAPSAGHGSGFSVTGSGLIGLLESTPATAIEMAISAGAAAHEFGGAVKWPSFDEGGGVSSIGGQPGSTGQMGGAPGGSLISAAINIGMEELNAGISAAGRAIAAGVGGLQQTFGLQQFAQTPLGQQSWITRFVGGMMGAQPQLPNLAGMKSAPAPPSMSGPAQKAGTVGPSSAPLVNIENYNANNGEHSAGADIARHAQAAYSANSLTGSR